MTLRDETIRLAYHNPHLRAHLLPLLEDGSQRTASTDGLKESLVKLAYQTPEVRDDILTLLAHNVAA